MAISSGLSGQRVLVTASSRGIGFGAATAFLQEGASVVINSSNKERLSLAERALDKFGKVHGVVADLSSKDQIDHLISETINVLSGIDTLVYVTGSPKTGLFMEQGYDDWETAARLLTVSPAYLARRVAEIMIKNGVKGRMVFLASYSIREPIPNIATSNVCRIAIAGIVRTLARELAPKGIRVNAVLPGFIQTARVEQITDEASRRRGITKEQAREEIEKQIPLGYIATPAQLAKSIVFLGSEMSEYVTGTMLPVDGGLLRSIG